MTENNTNIPREIYIRSNKQDFIGKKLEFQKIQGDYAYYAKFEGACTITDYLNIKNIKEYENKSFFYDRKSLIEATLNDINRLKEKAEAAFAEATKKDDLN